MGEAEAQLEKALSYWKAYVTVHDVLACELSYSMIYNNIQPEKSGRRCPLWG